MSENHSLRFSTGVEKLCEIITRTLPCVNFPPKRITRSGGGMPKANDPGWVTFSRPCIAGSIPGHHGEGC